jgi:cobalt-zinc-cadmium efflux system protein
MTSGALPSHERYEQLKNRLFVALIFNALIILAEVVGGFFSRSIGLMSDAMHNSIDQGVLFLSLYAHILSAQPPTKSKTFGYHRFGIVATFINTLALLITAVILAVWAVFRFIHPVPISSITVVVVAFLSAFANFGIALVLQKWSEGDLNIRSAFLHMLYDAWVSLGVVGSALAILATHWLFWDPLISLIIVAVIIKGAWPLFKHALEILSESAPKEMDADKVTHVIQSIPEVKSVHDIHIWEIEPRIPIMTCHVIIEDKSFKSADSILKSIRTTVLRECKIRHQTIQLETECCHSGQRACNLDPLAHPLP